MTGGSSLRFVILGAAGDLTARLLLPALVRLVAEDRLPRRLQVVAVDRADFDTDAYRAWVAEALNAGAADVSADAHAQLVASTEYRSADVTDGQAVAAALEPLDEPAVVYLALPPTLFGAAIGALAHAGLSRASRIVVEKPFGDGLDAARELNRQLAEVVPEEAVHRVDHFLSKQTAQNVLGLRFANRIFEPLWGRHHVERVEIVWDETLTVEGRAGYYDHAGALRDMLQNHLLQLVALVAMEPPASVNARDLRDRKVDLLRSIRTLDADGVAQRTVRARYGGGRIGDRDVPAYVDEPDVDGARGTETFAAVELNVDNWRWAGVPFLLRSGKALGRDRHEISIHFQPVPHLAFGLDEQPRPNVLRLQLDPDIMRLDVVTNGAGDPLTLEHVTFGVDLAAQDIPAYGRVILDVLEGDPTFSIRDDEAEESWRIMEPILEHWSAGVAPLREYEAGGVGPTLAPSGA